MQERQITIDTDTRVSAMNEVIRKLRKDDLSQGDCFLILDDNLPHDQAYYEYPDGRIQIEQVNIENIDVPRFVVRALTRSEIEELKKKNDVFR